jgi:small subunit ribosomal protein S19
MPRSLKKGVFCSPKLLQKIRKLKALGEFVIEKTWARSSTILPEMVGFTINVHNGKQFIPVIIDDEKVMHKLGEFAPTTKFKAHGGKKATEK